MHVRKVEPMSVAYPEPNDANLTRCLTFCRIEADDGTVGWGEAVPMSGSGFPEACRATEAVIDGLASLVVGRSPLDNLEIVDAIKKRTWWYGPEGIAAFALSAIDMALWDLRGKLTNQSLVAMLGGAVRRRIPASAATHATLPDIEAEAARHGEMIRRGFSAVKVGFSERSGGLGVDAARDVRFFQLLREACGPAAGLMVDRGQSLRWTVSYAIDVLRRMEEYGLVWAEEPLEPHDLEGFRRLRSHLRTLIATGERTWGLPGYRALIASGVADVIGCDPGRAEGVTGFVRVVEAVAGTGLWFNAHSWSSALNTAASLAVSATSDRCLYFELKPDENPMQHELVDEPFEAEDGFVVVREGPGLGVQVRESVLEKYRG
jgi:L-alanine-DL-glutamate epimerase-like enolase superfamily enzyme